MTRIVACQGGAQLVTACIAAQLDSRHSTEPDVLVIHTLYGPGKQDAAFAATLREMAGLLKPWDRIVYLGPCEIGRLKEDVERSARSEVLARFRALLGVAAADQLCVSQNQNLVNKLLLNAFPDASAVCYGDGIGVNFSQQYFAPSDEERENDSRKSSGRVRSLVRDLRAAARRAVGPRHRRTMGDVATQQPPLGMRPFDEYRLLLPNLFDEVRSEVTHLDSDSYVEAFARLSSLLTDVPPVLNGSVSLASGRELCVVLTSNFSESGKMPVDHELAAYETVIESHSTAEASIIIKPHPRDSRDKLQRLSKTLSSRGRSITLLDDDVCFYFPFEAIFAKEFFGQGADLSRTRVIAFSTACLSLALLYGVSCEIGFGREIVEATFAPRWIQRRLRHEYDLQRAIENIAARNPMSNRECPLP